MGHDQGDGVCLPSLIQAHGERGGPARQLCLVVHWPVHLVLLESLWTSGERWVFLGLGNILSSHYSLSISPLDIDDLILGSILLTHDPEASASKFVSRVCQFVKQLQNLKHSLNLFRIMKREKTF
jgi:hypothetical protein